MKYNPSGIFHTTIHQYETQTRNVSRLLHVLNGPPTFLFVFASVHLVFRQIACVDLEATVKTGN